MEPGMTSVGGGTALLILLAIFVASGLVTGALARLALPGRDDMSLGRTILYGIGGSLIGGLVSRLLGVDQTLANVVIAVAAAAALIWFFTRRGKSK